MLGWKVASSHGDGGVGKCCLVRAATRPRASKWRHAHCTQNIVICHRPSHCGKIHVDLSRSDPHVLFVYAVARYKTQGTPCMHGHADLMANRRSVDRRGEVHSAHLRCSRAIILLRRACPAPCRHSLRCVDGCCAASWPSASVRRLGAFVVGPLPPSAACRFKLWCTGAPHPGSWQRLPRQILPPSTHREWRSWSSRGRPLAA